MPAGQWKVRRVNEGRGRPAGGAVATVTGCRKTRRHVHGTRCRLKLRDVTRRTVRIDADRDSAGVALRTGWCGMGADEWHLFGMGERRGAPSGGGVTLGAVRGEP